MLLFRVGERLWVAQLIENLIPPRLCRVVSIEAKEYQISQQGASIDDDGPRL
jgi:hypothetical protein